MKKALLILTLVVALVSCSKERLETAKSEPATTETYFSHIRQYKDNRTPSVDTIWTLQMLNSEMTAFYKKEDGKVYFDASTYREVGVLWSK